MVRQPIVVEPLFVPVVPEPEPPKEEAEMSVPKKIAEATLAVSSGLAISGLMY